MTSKGIEQSTAGAIAHAQRIRRAWESDALEEMINEGHLGRKTGKGFYEYPE